MAGFLLQDGRLIQAARSRPSMILSGHTKPSHPLLLAASMCLVLSVIPDFTRGEFLLKGIFLHDTPARIVVVLMGVMLGFPLWKFFFYLYAKSKAAAFFHAASVFFGCITYGLSCRALSGVGLYFSFGGILIIWMIIHFRVRQYPENGEGYSRRRH